MWDTLQVHRIMQAFIDADFRNGPKIVPVIVLHLLENRVGRHDVDSLGQKLQDQSALVVAQRRDLDKLISTVSGLKKQLDHKGGGGRHSRACQGGSDGE